MAAYEGEDRRSDKLGRVIRDVHELKTDVAKIKNEMIIGDKRMSDLQQAQAAQAYQVSLLARDLAANTETTKAIKADTADMVQTFKHLVGFRTTMKWLGGTIVAVAAGVVAFDTLYTRIKGPVPSVPVVATPVPANPVVNQPPK